MSAMQLAAVRLEPLDVSVARYARTLLRCLWNGVEYVHDAGPMSRVQPPVGVHLVSALRPVVAAQRLVRADPPPPVIARRPSLDRIDQRQPDRTATRPHDRTDTRESDRTDARQGDRTVTCQLGRTSLNRNRTLQRRDVWLVVIVESTRAHSSQILCGPAGAGLDVPDADLGTVGMLGMWIRVHVMRP
jgi:hypothetical protein